MNPQYQEKIEALYLEMYNNLFEYAAGTLQNESLAEEAVQDTFRIACQKPQAVCESPNPQGWLINTLKYVISNAIKNRNVSNRILMDYYKLRMSEIRESSDPEDFELLYRDLSNLEEYRLVKEMYFDGKSYLELARERNISVIACRKRMQRARNFLRNKIK